MVPIIKKGKTNKYEWKKQERVGGGLRFYDGNGKRPTVFIDIV